MKLDDILRAVWSCNVVVSATRMQHDSVCIRANVPDRRLHLFDSGDVVGAWSRMPEAADETGNFGGAKKDIPLMVDFLLGKITMDQFYKKAQLQQRK